MATGDKITIARKDYVDTGLGTKQDTLVSGTNIKTVNGGSIVGSGDLVTPSANMGYESIYNTIVDFDLGSLISGSGNDTIKFHVNIFNSGEDYKFISLCYIGSSYYAVPYQVISGVQTIGTPVLLPSGTLDKCQLISGNRIIVYSSQANFYIIDYTNSLSPTVGVAYVPPTSASNLTMIVLDATRVVYHTSESTPAQYVGTLDFGASGTIITFGDQLSLGIAYNSSAYNRMYLNTATGKVDLITRSALSTYEAIQLYASGTSMSKSTSASIITTTSSADISPAVHTIGTYLITSWSTSVSRSVHKVVFSQVGGTPVTPTVTTVTESVTTVPIVATFYVLIATKVSGIYIMLGGQNTNLYDTTLTSYFIYDANTDSLTAGTTQYKSLFLHSTGIPHQTMVGKSINKIGFAGNSSTRDYYTIISISDTTGDITGVSVSGIAGSNSSITISNIGDYIYASIAYSTVSWCIRELLSGETIWKTVSTTLYTTNGISLSGTTLLNRGKAFTDSIGAQATANSTNYIGTEGYIQLGTIPRITLIKPKV